MTKQEILDLEANTPEIWAIQQMTTMYSKTSIAALERSLRLLTQVLYKSTTQSLTLKTIEECAYTASKLLHDGQIDDNQLEDKFQIR